MKASLDELMRESVEIRHQLSAGEAANRKLVDRLADEFVQNRFQDSLELIQIRYRELDRETTNGRTPLSDDSPLNKLLREFPSAAARK